MIGVKVFVVDLPQILLMSLVISFYVYKVYNITFITVFSVR